MEELEERSLPSNYTATNLSELTADINAANNQGGSNTISLTAPTNSPYVLSANGFTGLPAVANNDQLTILGNGDTIAADWTSATPAFSVLSVATGASATLSNLTLESSGPGGLYLNGSSITLANDNVDLNSSGGLYITGSSVVLAGDTVNSNSSGGVFINSATVALSYDNVTFFNSGGLYITGTSVGLACDNVVSINSGGLYVDCAT